MRSISNAGGPRPFEAAAAVALTYYLRAAIDRRIR